MRRPSELLGASARLQDQDTQRLVLALAITSARLAASIERLAALAEAGTGPVA
jgi:hypothetical protein